MRVGFDATPAALQVAGVGRYTRELLRALMPLDASDEYRLLCAAPEDATLGLLESLPPGASRTMRCLPVSNRYVTAAWHRLRLPLRVERLTGRIDVFHGPDFVVPPTRAATVVTIHDLSFMIRPDLGEPSLVNYLSLVVPRSITSADRIIAVSGAVAAEVIDRFPAAHGRVVAIPNGVRLPECTTTPRKTGRPVVLIVGTIEPRKNHVGLVEAMRHVRLHYPDAMLHVAGLIGWRSDDIVSVLREEERQGRLTVFEGPSDERLDELYATADVFAYPSWYEGFGLPVLEAMARGLPVVAADSPALREAGGSVARYADPADPEQLGARILDILDNHDRRMQLGEMGMQRAARFSWRNTAAATRRVYLQLTQGDGDAA